MGVGGRGTPLYGMSRPKRYGLVYVRFWSEKGYRCRPFWSEIEHAFTLAWHWAIGLQGTIDIIICSPSQIFTPMKVISA